MLTSVVQFEPSRMYVGDVYGSSLWSFGVRFIFFTAFVAMILGLLASFLCFGGGFVIGRRVGKVKESLAPCTEKYIVLVGGSNLYFSEYVIFFGRIWGYLT